MKNVFSLFNDNLLIANRVRFYFNKNSKDFYLALTLRQPNNCITMEGVQHYQSHYYHSLTSEMVHVNTQNNGINIQNDFDKLNATNRPLFNMIKKLKD